MPELFKFRKASSTVPDLSGIAGFGENKEEPDREMADKVWAKTIEDIKSPEIKPSYFAPQATILRIGADVAVKVVVQTLIRDEKALEELREKIQAAAYQIEQHIQERLDGEASVGEAGDMDPDPR